MAIDRERYKELGFDDEFVAEQMKIINYFKQLGIELTFTCAPYIIIKPLKFGSHVAWCESSAITYINSIWGARTNRECAQSALLAAITGRTPEFGMHITEERKGTHHVKVIAKLSDESDFSALGYYVGKVLGPSIPVFEGVPKPKFDSYFRALSAGLALMGGIPMFHMIGVTPEAKTLNDAFQGDVPEDKLEGLAHSWENVKKCGVAFAMQEDNAGYLPLGKSFDNSIRVFFPTKESFPLPLLFHATYYADSARKTINIEHKYNQFLTEKAVEFFVSSVIPRLTDGKFAEDPCAHLDLLTRSSQREKTVGAYFGDLLFQALLETNIIPDSRGVLREPKELKKLPFDTAKWEEWYSLLGEEGCADLRLVHIDCRKPDRFQLLLDLDVEMLSFEEVVQSLEVHVVKDKNAVWFSKLYQEIAVLKYFTAVQVDHAFPSQVFNKVPVQS